MSDKPNVKHTHYRYSWADAVKAVECLESLGKSYDVKKRSLNRTHTTYERHRWLPWILRPVTTRVPGWVWFVEEHE